MFTYKRRKITYSLLLPFAALLLVYVSLPIVASTSWVTRSIESRLSESLGRKVSLGAPVSLRVFPTLAVTLKDLSLANISGLSRRDMLTIGRLHVTAPIWKNLVGEYHIQSVEVSRVSIQVATTADGRSNTAFRKSPKAKKKESTDSPVHLPTIDDVTLNHTRLTLGDNEDSREFYFKELTARHLFGDSEHTLVSSVSISDSPFSVIGSSSPVQVFINDGDLDFKIHIEKDALQIESYGKFTHNGIFKAHFDVTGEGLDDFGRIFKAELPSWKNYTLKSDVTFGGSSTHKLDLTNTQITLENSDLSGDIGLSFSPFSVNARLTSDKLDLPHLLHATSETSESEDRGEARIPHDLFQSFDADVELKVEELTTFLGVELTEAELAAQVKDGVLDLPQFKANALGGSFTSHVTVGNGQLAASLDGSHFHVNPIMELSGGKSLIEGDFDLAFDLESKGSLVSEIVNELNGTLQVSSENGKITSSTIRSTSGSLLQIVNPIFSKKKIEEVECMLFRFDVKNGVARSREHVLKLGEVFFFAEGKLNFPAKRVTYNFHVNSQNPSLTSLIPPFRMAGSLGSPAFTPSVSGTLASAADTTEGVARAAFGALGRTASFLVGSEIEDLQGIKKCKKAYEVEQDLLSSRIGSIIDDE